MDAKKQQAQITVVDVPDGGEVTIEYDDGHVVKLNVSAGSPVLARHLGFDDLPVAEDAD